jgi:hypothetical protein
MTSSYSAEQALKAWQTLEDLAQRLSIAPFKGLRAVFVIGSLPGGYFRPGQSDLDVVALFNDPPRRGADLTTLRTEFEEMVQPEKLAHPFEVECLPRFVSELGRNPESGLLQNPDLVARLKVQSRQLFGNYPVQTLPTPSAEEWSWETRRFMRWWDEKTQKDSARFATHPKQIKKTLALVRLYLAVRRDLVEYNKFKLLEAYEQAIPVVPISLGTRMAIQTYLTDGELNTQAQERLERELPDIQSALVKAIL